MGVVLLAGLSAQAEPLAQELGRSEVRVYSEAYPIPVGRTVAEAGLAERLERLGYTRVRGRKPAKPGEYFWGHEIFRIYRHAHRLDGRWVAAQPIAVRLARPRSRILGPAVAGRPESEAPLPTGLMPYLEPELLAESLEGNRAPRIPVELAELPEPVWQALLAIEDARFFGHSGIDYRGIARALLANAKAGKVKQGGSTITQQLIKMRDLSPKRSLGRKASEALRALALEAEHDKRDILESYLNHVYYGHIEGVAIHGVGAASRAFFGKPASRLSLTEAALLAGMIQSPNRLSPVRHPAAARERRDRVIERMVEVGWVSREEADRALSRGLGVSVSKPRRRGASHFLSWVAATLDEEAPRWKAKGRGVVAQTHLDPYLQQLAERAVAERLDELRRGSRRLRRAPLSAALVALDAETGAVLAYVGGDPRSGRGGFDRARKARRQPGSTVKPLVLLEAFDRCARAPEAQGRGKALNPASRVADEALTLDLPSGPWRPENSDDRFRGVVDLRTALADSLNLPFVRIGRWCGFAETAGRLRAAGLQLPHEPPPSFVLGAVEVSPLELAQTYTVFATPGEVAKPRPVGRFLRPGGRSLERIRPRRSRVVRPASAYLVRDLMRQAVESGTARAARLPEAEAAGKTGTSSDRRDAWFAGVAGSVVTVVWVGRDDAEPLGLTGSAAAAPLWRAFMEKAVPARAPLVLARPSDVLERNVDPETGLLVRGWGGGSYRELFRRGALPPRDRILRRDRPVPVIR